MNIEQLYHDHGIKAVTEGQHKHARPGWINCACPFCTGHEGYHLGFNYDSEIYVCWRCGAHPLVKTLSELLNISIKEVKKLLPSYSTRKVKKTRETAKNRAFKLPSNLMTKFPPAHRAYLEGRGFDPELIQKVWGIKCTGRISTLSDGDKIINYGKRIFIPVRNQKKLVTFQTRAIRDSTDSGFMKYLACPESREIMNIKTILYGKDIPYDFCFALEGVTDVWKVGKLAKATFGITWKHAQMRELAKFKRVAIAYDPDPQAQEQAKKLMNALLFRGVECINLELEKDPGSMEEKDIQYMIKYAQKKLLK